MAPPYKESTPGELLRQLRERRGITSVRQAARQAGLSHTSISSYESSIAGIGMLNETINRLARIYDVPREFIDKIATGAITELPEDLDALKRQDNGQTDSRVRGMVYPVRFLGSVSAGFDGAGIATPVSFLGVADFFLKNHNADDVYALEVTGDSMLADDVRHDVPPGSIVLIHERLQPIPGQIVVAWLENEDVGVLKVYREENGEVWLVSHNAEHPPVKIDADTPASLRGVMIAQWKKAPGF